MESVPLGKLMAEAAAFYCPGCRKVILDVPEIETLEGKVAGMVDSLYEQMDKAAGERQVRRDEEKKQKKREKDPWE